MFDGITRKTDKATPSLAESERLQQILGLDKSLPQRLLVRADGRAYSCVQLEGAPKGGQGPAPLEVLSLLKRTRYLGGWEPLVTGNRQNAIEETLGALERRLGGGEVNGSLRRFLQDFTTGLVQVQGTFRTRLQDIEARLEDANDRVTKWQSTQNGDREPWGGVGRVVRELFRMTLSDSDAVQSWNERETLALARDTHTAAIAVLSHVVEALERISKSLEQALAEAGGAIRAAEERALAIAQRSGRTQFYDYQVNVTLLADGLTQGRVDSRHYARLFTALREGGSTALLTNARAMAQDEAERIVGGLDIIQLLELEGDYIAQKRNLQEPVDVVVRVGERLLDHMKRKAPSWKLTSARAGRSETLQIVPGGEPLFEHGTLKTASFGARRDCLAFLDVHLEVALDEILLMKEWRRLFTEARGKREYFILEEVIARAGVPDAPVAAAVGPVPPAPAQTIPAFAVNGTGDTALVTNAPGG